MENNRIKILEFAKKEMRSLEPWDGYFDFRFLEFDILFDFLKKDINRDFKKMKVLEIGTGIGLAAGFLAEEFKEVITTDLPEQSDSAHSIGKEKINNFLEGLNMKNVKYFPADARNLSIFEDNSFDAVYSSQVFEHIPISDRNLVLEEIKRVLKNNGLLITVVPNFMERIYEFFHYYVDFFIRKSKVFFQDPKIQIFKKNSNKLTYKIKKRWWKKILLPPHGAYKNSFQEFLYHFPIKWISLHKRFFNVIAVYTNKVSIPLSTPFFLNFYKQYNKIDRALGRIPPFKYLGRTLAIVCINNK